MKRILALLLLSLRLGISTMSLLVVLSCHSQSAVRRENGWYRIVDGQGDSLSRNPIVTVKEFVGLRMEKDFFGKCVISGTVGKQKRRAWADSTERSIGKRIGFVFNDSVITAPKVNMRLESGNFQIATLQAYDMEALYRDLMREKGDSLDALFKANGWTKDTLFLNGLDKEMRDSIVNVLDYTEACAVVKGFKEGDGR